MLGGELPRLLSCSIETNGIGHSAGFDGIIFTSDPSYVPDEAAGSAACANDAEFTTDCGDTNWSPGIAPATGFCNTTEVGNGTECFDNGGGAGFCCSGTCQASCP